MKNIIIWGTGSYYAKHIAAFLDYERKLKNINVICFTGNSVVEGKKDGVSVCNKKLALQQKFDYIIVASEAYEKEIISEIVNEFKVDSAKIIPGRVFKLPYFNLMRYLEVKSSNLTIIAESCYGSTFSHALGLEFRSPFVNLRISPKDYLKILNNPMKYLTGKVEICEDTTLTHDDRISWGIIGEPLLKLENDVNVHCVHIGNSEDALYQWNRRRIRINYDNILYMMIIETEEELKEFQNVKGIRKVGFYHKPIPEDEHIIYLEDWDRVKQGFGYFFRKYVHSLFEGPAGEIDLFSLAQYELDKIVR